MNEEYGIDPQANPNGEYLWDDKNILRFGKESTDKYMGFTEKKLEDNSEVGLMDVINDQEGRKPSFKKKS